MTRKTPTHDFRLVYYDHDGKRHTVLPANTAEDTEDALAERLDDFVESGSATGGHLEQYVPGINWVLCD